MPDEMSMLYRFHRFTVIRDYIAILQGLRFRTPSSMTPPDTGDAADSDAPGAALIRRRFSARKADDDTPGVAQKYMTAPPMGSGGVRSRVPGKLYRLAICAQR